MRKSHNLERKGQLSLFLVLGVIIVAGALIFFTLSDKSTSDRDVQSKVVDVPVEFQPISNFIDNCIIHVATEGLQVLGLQGGYIDVEKAGLFFADKSTESELVEHPPGSGTMVPYWYYLESDNSCEANCNFDSKRPSLYRGDGEPSIEGQLDTYVNENLPDCLTNFGPLIDAGFEIKEVGEVDTTTTVTSSDVLFVVNYPIEVIKDGTTSLDEFFVRIPVNMKKMFEQATSLTTIQMDQQYIEKSVLNLLVAFSSVDENMLPPRSGVTFEFGSTTHWFKSQVAGLIKSMLGVYIQGLRVYNTINHNPVTIIGEPRREAMYNQGMLIPASPDAEDFKVFYSYLDWWDIYFNLNCDGELCTPESVGTELLPVLGIQRYTFLYDISFPVLVEVYDPAALNNQGYKFQFMLEANIRNNERMDKDFLQLDALSIRQSSQLCDIDKRNSGNISVKVVEEGANSNVESAQVTFSCGRESCFIGKTPLSGELTEQFPICLGGLVSFLHPDYLKRTVHLSPKLDETYSINMSLFKREDVPYEVKKFKLTKGGGFWNLNPVPLPLDDKEISTLIFTRLGIPEDGD
ncbi:MAG: hypothetical protein QF915_01135, partial [Candidatus Woesearchaeota archaeon]|nr:hypothetical protein [Candidatus Woesearchaeota archaeon]